MPCVSFFVHALYGAFRRARWLTMQKPLERHSHSQTKLSRSNKAGDGAQSATQGGTTKGSRAASPSAQQERLWPQDLMLSVLSRSAQALQTILAGASNGWRLSGEAGFDALAQAIRSDAVECFPLLLDVCDESAVRRPARGGAHASAELSAEDGAREKERALNNTVLGVAASGAKSWAVDALVANPKVWRWLDADKARVFAEALSWKGASHQAIAADLAPFCDPLPGQWEDIALSAVRSGRMPALKMAAQRIDLSQPMPHRHASDSFLHEAACGGNEAIVDFLLAVGCDPNERNRKGRTPLMIAAQDEASEIMFKRLLSASNIDAQDDQGQTALMFAVSHADGAAIAQWLMNAGADAKIQDAEGDTALIIATRCAYQDEQWLKMLGRLAQQSDLATQGGQGGEKRTALQEAAKRLGQLDWTTLDALVSSMPVEDAESAMLALLATHMPQSSERARAHREREALKGAAERGAAESGSGGKPQSALERSPEEAEKTVSAKKRAPARRM